MKKRDTERKHAFADELFEKCNIYDLQGLLLNKDYEFKTAIEGVYLEENENWRELNQLFSSDEINAKLLMAEKLNIPFYIICHSFDTNKSHKFEIIKYYRIDKGIYPNLIETFDELKFISWWKELKGTIQTKGFRNEAKERTINSYIDIVLAKYGLMWGGNVDGFMLSEDKSNIRAIIEKRICNENTKIKDYNPAKYFYNAKDPLRNDYFTWKPLIKLAIALKSPLYLMTFQNNVNDKFGISHVKNIINGLNFYGRTPNSNLKRNINDFSLYYTNSFYQKIPNSSGNCEKCTNIVYYNDADECIKRKSEFQGKIYCENCRSNFKKSSQLRITCEYGNCNRVISDRVKKYCEDNKVLFNNKYYCYDHQRNFK